MRLRILIVRVLGIVRGMENVVSVRRIIGGVGIRLVVGSRFIK